MKWDYEGPFLKTFPAGRRARIANQFCAAVRQGCGTVDEVLCYVRAEANHSVSHGWDDEAGSQTLLLQLTATEDARGYAQHIIDRESLSQEEKDRLKGETGSDFRRLYMSEAPATERQLVYLRFLGCDEIPTSMLEASNLIEQYKDGSVQRSKQAAAR